MIIKGYKNNKLINTELTEEEIAQMETEAKVRRLQELTRPRTIEEGMLELNKSILMDKLAETEDKTLAISCMVFFESWTRGVYEVGDIRTNPTTGYPYECILAHDSTNNPDWDITVRTLWKPYHSRKKEYALPYEAPTGNHDMYKQGEYMIFNEEIYLCKADTNYNPTEYTGAWELV